jgi:hypothetical protein
MSAEVSFSRTICSRFVFIVRRLFLHESAMAFFGSSTTQSACQVDGCEELAEEGLLLLRSVVVLLGPTREPENLRVRAGLELWRVAPASHALMPSDKTEKEQGNHQI